jgi:hypothetical protein
MVSGGKQPDNLAGVGVSAQRALGKNQHTVAGNFEDATASLQHLDGRVGICLTNLGRQTGGLRFVISNDAIADRYMHWLRIWSDTT